MMKFNEIFEPIKNQFPRYAMSEGTSKRVNDFARSIIQTKKQEAVHQKDNGSEMKRWKTGMAGELVVEKCLGVDFVDWTIGESAFYNVADLRKIGLNIGVKTVEYGKFPIIHKRTTRPEIIVVKEGNRFYLCGLATIDVLNTYRDDNLILSPKLRQRNVKTGFYGFQHLRPFKSLEELVKITQSLKIGA